MGGFPFSRRYEPLSSVSDIIKAVADDPYGIGLVGPHEIATLPPTVRLLPLGEQAPFRAADGADLKAGLYPLAEFLHLYINLRPGQAPEPLVGDYVRLVLSADGQQVISAAGHVPLPAREIEDQLAKLNQPAPSR